MTLLMRDISTDYFKFIISLILEHVCALLAQVVHLPFILYPEVTLYYQCLG